MRSTTKTTLTKIYSLLFRYFGPQYWWPGKTPCEIAIGAILTQNTNWGNVEKAVGSLRRQRLLTPQKIRKLPLKRLAQLIRPAGYFNVKARRLKNFIEFLFQEYAGSFAKMSRKPIFEVRTKLLRVNGIGPETADSILLYALHKPVFVIDTYTKRMLIRHNFIDDAADYETIQRVFMTRLPSRVKLFNEYHALIVRLGKEMCRTKPRCETCPLRAIPFR